MCTEISILTKLGHTDISPVLFILNSNLNTNVLHSDINDYIINIIYLQDYRLPGFKS